MLQELLILLQDREGHYIAVNHASSKSRCRLWSIYIYNIFVHVQHVVEVVHSSGRS